MSVDQKRPTGKRGRKLDQEIIRGRELQKQRQKKCDVCSRTDPHIHCPECGSTEHVAADCDMLG